MNTRFYFHSLEGLKTAGKAGLKLLVCEHGSAYLSLDNTFLDLLIKIWEHLITVRVKSYHPASCAVSKKSAEWLHTFGAPCEGILSNSIDAAAFRNAASSRDFRHELGLPDADFIICFIGRYVPEKGIVKLLDAMKQLEDVPIKLFMAGVGPLKERIDACGLGSVYDSERLEPADVAALMIQSNSDALGRVLHISFGGSSLLPSVAYYPGGRNGRTHTVRRIWQSASPKLRRSRHSQCGETPFQIF